MNAIVMTEEYWANSQLSIARHYGHIRIDGYEYEIVDKFGRTLFETSIPVGASADLCRRDFIPFYKKLGREKFLSVVKAGNFANNDELKDICKKLIADGKERKKAEKARREPSLFD